MKIEINPQTIPSFFKKVLNAFHYGITYMAIAIALMYSLAFWGDFKSDNGGCTAVTCVTIAVMFLCTLCFAIEGNFLPNKNEYRY